MKLAVSNIAWVADEDVKVEEVLVGLGVGQIEIAPTRKWSSPLEASDQEIESYQKELAAAGLEIVAMQSLLFGQPQFNLFADASSRQAMFDYMAGIISLGGKLGAKALVFGSPKNRLRGELAQSEANAIAVEFFKGLGEVAKRNGTCLCIEPNPTAYGCDFVVNTQEGIELVERVNHEGFRLHLDAAGATLAGDDLEAAIKKAQPLMRHFHISAPNLGLVGEGEVDHRRAAKALRDISYSGTVSIEMRAGVQESNVESVKSAVEFVQRTYF